MWQILQIFRPLLGQVASKPRVWPGIQLGKAPTWPKRSPTASGTPMTSDPSWPENQKPKQEVRSILKRKKPRLCNWSTRPNQSLPLVVTIFTQIDRLSIPTFTNHAKITTSRDWGYGRVDHFCCLVPLTFMKTIYSLLNILQYNFNKLISSSEKILLWSFSSILTYQQMCLVLLLPHRWWTWTCQPRLRAG